jgi:5-methylcytosine-specific restriction enzyme A
MASKPWQHQGSRHDRGYGYNWSKLRLTILDRDMHLCQTCLANGRPTQATEVDHVTPKADGGTDDPSNLVAICTTCHMAKTQAEAAKAQGRTCQPRRQIGNDGWPVT